MSVRMNLLSAFILLVIPGLLTAAEDIVTHTQRYERNNQATLPCRVNNPASQDVVQWFRGTTLISSGSIVYGVLRGRIHIGQPAPGEWNLVIARVDESFANTYLCKTRSGDKTLSSIKLIIETPPKIDEEASTKEHTVFEEHSYAKLECKVSGEPPPEITWFRGDTLDSTEIGVKGEVLIIPNIERYAADEYTCLAKNKHGESERRMSVDVKFGPDVSVMNSTLYAEIGANIVMACRIQAYPLPNAYWTNHENKYVKSNWKYEIIEETEQDHFPVRFIVLAIKPSTFSVHDRGEYKCTAIGDGGEERSAVVNLTSK